ncbi:MAG: response regulator [Acidobacteriota bacterium]|nr:response regulator [Acidobacteriota bacterium]
MRRQRAGVCAVFGAASRLGVDDIELKETNGIAATRLITRDFPEAKIVIVTNYNDERLREAAAEAGARGYVLKENLLSLGAFLNV